MIYNLFSVDRLLILLTNHPLFLAIMTDEKRYQLALSFTPGIGSVLLRSLVSYCGSASEVFKAGIKKLEKIPGIGQQLSQAIINKSSLLEADKELELAQKQGVDILFYTDSTYPNRLKHIYDAPALLYWQGKADLNALRTVSIVGTRQATDYGKAVTDKIIEDLKPYNVLLVSGLAYGIDIAAHKACLKNNVATVGVMASGIDIIYPSSHAKVAESMKENGGILTENRFGQAPDAPRFPARNRIIAGIADAVIVIETANKGGTLITAEYANNYHKEVFAVPGELNSKFSEGCNLLINRNKAAIYTSINDIVKALNWDLDKPNSSKISKEIPFDYSQFTEQESQIIALLRKNKDMHIDEIAWQSQMSMNALASLLLNLEFQGVIKSMPGKKYGVVYTK
jgi:DNA processing protein